MKKIRLAILLTVVLAMSSMLTACGGNSDMKKYFNPEANAITTYSSVSRLDGDLCAYNRKHNIIALKTEEFSASGSKSENIRVFNALDGKQLVSNSQYYTDDTVSFDVQLDKYPLIVFKSVSIINSNSYPEYESRYDYYLVENGSDVHSIITGTKDNLEDYRSYVNGVMTFSVGKTTYWVNRKGEVVREFLSSVTEAYGSPDSFYAEYKDYLYDWTLPNFNGGSPSALGYRIHVFNKDGVCCVQYVLPATVVMAEAFVLNDGNVFVQEYELALDGKEHNFVLDMGGIKVNANVKSKIINYQTGEVTELNLGFVVMGLESYYNTENSTDSYFPLVLAKGYQNQAVVADFDSTGYSAKRRYVVLDNLMNIQYEIQNDAIATSSDFEIIGWVGEDHYLVGMETSEGAKGILFDLEGKAVLEVNEASFVGYTDEYVVTADAIYNVKGKSVYNFSDLIAGDKDAGIEIIDNKIYVGKKNYTTGCIDVYKIGVDKKKVVANLVSAGINSRFYDLGGAYVTYDLEMGVSSFTTQDGKLLLKVKGDIEYKTTVLEDAVIIEDVVNGDDVCYVIK